MDVADRRRYIQGCRAKHRHDAQVLGAVLDDDPPMGKRVRQRGIDVSMAERTRARDLGFANESMASLKDKRRCIEGARRVFAFIGCSLSSTNRHHLLGRRPIRHLLRLPCIALPSLVERILRHACPGSLGSGGMTRVLYAREITIVENHVGCRAWGCVASLAHAICQSFADF